MVCVCVFSAGGMMGLDLTWTPLQVAGARLGGSAGVAARSDPLLGAVAAGGAARGPVAPLLFFIICRVLRGTTTQHSEWDLAV